MNERITKFAEQAGKRGSPDHPLYWTNGINDTLEKFAELIVKRCLELCNKEHAGSIHTQAGPWNAAIKRCKESIETHFGVEDTLL